MEPTLSRISSRGFKPLVLTITREQIETLNLQPALDVIHSALSTPKVVAYNAGRLSLSVTGYVKGERILKPNREIIRKYFVALDREFNGWFHLCNRWDNTLRMLFLATTPLKEIQNVADEQAQLCFDLSELKLFISEHNMALMQLHRDNGIPLRTTEHIKKLMQAYFDNYFLKLKEEKL
jgi:hypothetical protein